MKSFSSASVKNNCTYDFDATLELNTEDDTK